MTHKKKYVKNLMAGIPRDEDFAFKNLDEAAKEYGLFGHKKRKSPASYFRY